MGEDRKCIKILVGKPNGKRQLGRPRHRWEDNIKRNIREISVRRGLDSCGSGQGPVGNSCGHSNEPSSSKNGWEFLH
jgi:hypothetical protein